MSMTSDNEWQLDMGIGNIGKEEVDYNIMLKIVLCRYYKNIFFCNGTGRPQM